MQIFFSAYNPNFQTRHLNYSKEVVTNFLAPLLERKLPYNEVKAESGLSDTMINRWFRETRGITSCRYFRALEKELKERENIIDTTYNTDDELKKIKKKEKNAKNKLTSQKPCPPRQAMYAGFEQNVPRMLEEGYNIKTISKILKCDKKTVTKWIHKYLCDDIRVFRRQDGIKIKKDLQA